MGMVIQELDGEEGKTLITENFAIELSGIEYQDWMDIQHRGKRLQARLLLTSGTFNINSVPLYARKLYSLLSRALRKAIEGLR